MTLATSQDFYQEVFKNSFEWEGLKNSFIIYTEVQEICEMELKLIYGSVRRLIN